jgi:hypothetical protein
MSAKMTARELDGEGASATERWLELSSWVKEKLAEVGRTAVHKVDARCEAAASGLESAADSLYEKADGLPPGENLTSVAYFTADKLASMAEYLWEQDVRRLTADVVQLLASHDARLSNQNVKSFNGYRDASEWKSSGHHP